MKTVHDVDILIKEIEDEMEKDADDKLPENKKSKYREYVAYLKKIKHKFAIEKYNFIFIGDKGIGKTTTILELFGLVRDGKDLLTTASGGTTTCEVEIVRSDEDKAYFEIIPTDDALMKQYVYDFCRDYVPQDENDSKKIQYVPTEIARSIRNMIGMKKTEIANLYIEISSFDDFVEDVLDRLNLASRTITRIPCDLKKGESLFENILRSFNEINLCKYPSIKLPQKIKLFITEELLDFSNHHYIHTIVDTRGIDSNISTSENKKEDNKRMKREDILHYIDNEEDNCIFIFMDGIKPAPSSSILELFSSRIIDENSNKFYLFINVHGNEAEEVLTDDGKANDFQTGIDYKKDDILKKFRHNNINFTDSNLIFYNARKDTPTRTSIIKQIEDNIESQKDKLLCRCSDVKKAFERLKYDFEDKEYAYKNFSELYNIVSGVSSPQKILDTVIEKFFADILNEHHARIAAINRNSGSYYGYEFYHKFSLTIEDIFNEVFLESKNDVIKKVKEFFSYKNINDIDKIDYNLFIEKLERDYMDYRKLLKDYLKQIFEKSFNSDSWIAAQKEYGKKDSSGKPVKTPSYKNRVIDIYKNELLLGFANACNVRDEYNTKWQEILKRNHLKDEIEF